MIEMTLSSRHRILGHRSSPQYWLSHVDVEETFFVSFKPPRPGIEPRTLAWKAAVLTPTQGPPPMYINKHYVLNQCCFNAGPPSATLGGRYINITFELTLIRHMRYYYVCLSALNNTLVICASHTSTHIPNISPDPWVITQKSEHTLS